MSGAKGRAPSGPRVNPWCLAAVYADLAGAEAASLAFWALNAAFRSTFAVANSTDMDLHLSRMCTQPGAPTVYHSFFDEICHRMKMSAPDYVGSGVDTRDTELTPVPFYVTPLLPAAELPEDGAAERAVRPLCLEAAFAFPYAVYDQTDLVLTAAQPRMKLLMRVPPGTQLANGATAAGEHATDAAWVLLSAEDLVDAIESARQRGVAIDTPAARAAVVRDAVRAWTAAGRVVAWQSQADLCRRNHVITLATHETLRGRRARSGGAWVITDYAYDEACFRRCATLEGTGAHLARYVWFNVQRPPRRPVQALRRVNPGQENATGGGNAIATTTATTSTSPVATVPLWVLVAADSLRVRDAGVPGSTSVVLSDAPDTAEVVRISVAN